MTATATTQAETTRKTKLHPSKDRIITPRDSVNIAGIELDTRTPPAQLRFHPDLGIVAPAGAAAQRLHLGEFTSAPRVTRSRDGEYLVFVPVGSMHYGWAATNANACRMMAFRSRDRGRTWSGPESAWDAGCNVHGAIPHQSRDGSILHAFGTEPLPEYFDRDKVAPDTPGYEYYDFHENAPIGWRSSKDFGRTWSPAHLIRPVNAPHFLGMSTMQMCETERGTWLLGSHLRVMPGPMYPPRTQQFILRSEDKGENWTLLPGPLPHGWRHAPTDRMDEGRPIHLGGDSVYFMVRTSTGLLWQMRSDDDGKTWSEAEPTPLRHPSAPPMLFHLGDGRTLIAFHHDYHDRDTSSPTFQDHARTELWFSTSEDEGRTWSAPRFLLANACDPAILTGVIWEGVSQMVSYCDLLIDNGEAHIFIDHQMRQALHVRMPVDELLALPTLAELRAMTS